MVKKEVSAEDVVSTLASYNLLSLLPNILETVKKLKSDQGAQDTIHVESPFEVSEEALARIKRIVGNDMAETSVTINKNILAGFKARYKGKLYDGSAERIIKNLTTY